jgi:hypothetical protein
MMRQADAMADGPSNKLVKRPDEALVKKAVAQPAPPMRLADSLEDAAPRTFVHVDRKGQVRSPARYKALQAASYGAAAAIVGGVTVMYGALLGIPGIGVGAAFAAYFGWHMRRSRLLHKATVLLVHDQLDEAEALLRKVLASWRCPKHVAALAEQNLGAVYNRRGNFEEALAHQRAAIRSRARCRRAIIFACSTGAPSSTCASPRASIGSIPSSCISAPSRRSRSPARRRCSGCRRGRTGSSATPIRRGTSSTRRTIAAKACGSSARCRFCGRGWKRTPPRQASIAASAPTSRRRKTIHSAGCR